MVESSDPTAWFKLAEQEFAYACRDLAQPERDFFAATCFHFQQAAEKALKRIFCPAVAVFGKSIT